MPDSEQPPQGTVAEERTPQDGASRRAGRGAERPFAAAMAVTLGVAVVVVSGPVQTWTEQRDRVAGLEASLGAFREENARLEARVEQLGDPDYVELEAREEQGMVRPGEEAYVVVPPAVDEPVIGAEGPQPQDGDGALARLWDALTGLFAG